MLPRRGVCGGTTSACAENTNNRGHFHPFSWNYLRVRGEYIINMKVNLIVGELPPRARRIQLPKIQRFAHVGTTSACAENTQVAQFAFRLEGNYLRVRGEYPLLCVTLRGRMELPPRARRIPLKTHLGAKEIGTTSACAENTNINAGKGVATGNYLRVRGEYTSAQPTAPKSTELPPRARRILHEIKIWG